MKVAVIGAGYWGKNLIRNLASSKNCQLDLVCDLSQANLARTKAAYPHVRITSRIEKVLEQADIEAVVIGTNAPTHHEVALACLKAGKHVYVEKPLALEVEHAVELHREALARKRVLMTGHLMKFHPGIEWIKERVDAGEFGDLRYLYFSRLNLGIVRKDENAWWSLAPHDVSIALWMLEGLPRTVALRGACYLRPDVQDVVFANLQWADGRMAQIHVSWLDPHKIRRFTAVGSRKMVTFDDMAGNEPVRVYDKGADPDVEYQDYGDSFKIRQGDILLPKIPRAEPLRVELEHFLHCVRTGETPRTDGLDGLNVVKVLDAGRRSLALGGAPVEL